MHLHFNRFVLIEKLLKLIWLQRKKVNCWKCDDMMIFSLWITEITCITNNKQICKMKQNFIIPNFFLYWKCGQNSPEQSHQQNSYFYSDFCIARSGSVELFAYNNKKCIQIWFTAAVWSKSCLLSFCIRIAFGTFWCVLRNNFHFFDYVITCYCECM